MSSVIGEELGRRIRAGIRDIPNFPQAGVVFKDITPLIADASLFPTVVQALADPFAGQGVDVVVGIESRGFIFGAPVALRLGCGFVPVRKPGKLPHRTVRIDYALEYGTDALEIHEDAIRPGQRVLVVDDVLATGGTAAGTAALVERLGGEILGLSFLVELGFLNGRDKLERWPVQTLVTYSAER